MMKMHELLLSGGVKLDLAERKKKRVIRELVGLLEPAGIKDYEKLAAKILEREKMTSTGIGHGVAIPHVLSNAVDRTVMVLGRSSAGIPFDSVDKKPVHLFFLIVGPASSTAEHLKILSKLGRMVTEPDFRESLMKAADEAEIRQIIASGEEL